MVDSFANGFFVALVAGFIIDRIGRDIDLIDKGAQTRSKRHAQTVYQYDCDRQKGGIPHGLKNQMRKQVRIVPVPKNRRR